MLHVNKIHNKIDNPIANLQ